jgi:uncharacterized SAM-binding protein YcdF (DUF218 family)
VTRPPILQPPTSSSGRSQRFLGIVTRRERWGLSWRGWLVVFAVVLLAFYVFLFSIYPFLAVTQRVDTNVLVMEGWIHPYASRAAAEEFRDRSYERVFTTGGPVEGISHYVNDYQTAASVGAGLLINAGVPSEVVQMVPSRTIDRDRTYSAAVALRNWLRQHGVEANRINIVTEDVHARRSRLLFQKALGKNVVVGIIAVPNPDYDSKHWWHYSEGVKDVISELAGYVYARFLFWPAISSTNEEPAGTSQAPR